MRILGAACAVLLLPASVALVAQGPDSLVEQVHDRLRNRFEAARASEAPLGVRGDRVFATQMLPTFFQRRLFAPAWIGDGGLLPRARVLLQEIARADEEGLRSDIYDRDRLLSAALDEAPPGVL